MSAPDPEQFLPIMSEGQAFYMYTGTSQKQAVKLFYVPGDPDDLGSIYWCEVHERARRPGQSFPLSSLTDVYMGKQTSSFLANTQAVAASEDHCFSICSETQTLDLEAGDAESVTVWLFGVNYALANEGKIVVTAPSEDEYAAVQKANDAAASASAATTVSPAEMKTTEPVPAATAKPATKGRRYTVTANQQAAAAQALSMSSSASSSASAGVLSEGAETLPFTASPSDPLYVIKTGETMTRYQADPERSENNTATQVKVFYAKNAPGRRVTPGQAKTRNTTAGSVDTVEESIGSFYIVPTDAPKSWSIVGMPSTTRIPLDDLTDLFLGPGNPNFTPFLATVAQQQACFTLATSADGAFSFETSSRAALAGWIACINALLTDSGAAMEVETAPAVSQAAPTSTAAATPEQQPAAPTKTRRFTVRSTDSAAAATAAAQAAPAQAAAAQASQSSAAVARESLIRSLARGLAFIIHPSNERVILSLDRTTSNLVLRNGLTPEAAASQVVRSKLSLKSLSDVFVGKSRPVFAQAKPGSATDRANRRICVSLLDVQGQEWSLEADSQETFACFMSALNHALTLAGRGTTEVDETKPAAAATEAQAAPAQSAAAQKGSRRFSVMPLKAGAASSSTAADAKPSAPAASTASTPSAAPEATAGTSMGVDEYLLTMARQGTEFMGFAERRGQLIRNAVNLFYVSAAELRALKHGPMSEIVGEVKPDTRGRLCWCAAGKRELRPRAFIEFGDITDIYLGKQTKLLANPGLKDVAADRAFSILTPNNQLDLEAKSVVALHAWLDLVQKLIVATGKSVVSDGKSDAPGAPAVPSTESDQRLVAKKQSKRFSVLATNASRSADAAAAAAAAREASAEAAQAAADAAVQRKMAVFQSPEVRFMVQGAPFTRYYNKKSGEDCQEDVLLFLQPSEEGGTLCWCPAADASSRTIKTEASMRICAITQIYTGRSTRALKALVPAQIDGKALMTLVADKRVLGLRAGSVEIAERWLNGIQAIIKHLGAAVEEEANAATAASTPTSQTTAASPSATPAAPEAATSTADAAAPNKSSGRRFTILRSQAPPMPTSPPPQVTASPTAATSTAAATAAPVVEPPKPKFEPTPAQTAAIQSLTRGLIVTEFSLVRGGEVAATRKRLIYVAPPPASASLAIVVEDATEDEIRAAVNGAASAPQGSGAQGGTARCRVFLMSGLRDVIIGRDDPIWMMPGATKNVRGERVFSIKSNVASAHIEAMSKDDVKVFLAAVQALVSAAGKEAYVEDKLPGSTAAGATGTAQKSASRRMSLLNAITNAAGPNTGRTSTASAGATSGPAPFRSTAHGSHFVLYRPLPGSDPADDLVTHCDIQLFHVHDTDVTSPSAAVSGTGGGVLCWTIPSTTPSQPPQRKMVRLNSLRTILRGKQTSCLRNACAGRAPDALCFSLVFAGGITLDLEADSAAHVDGWLRGIAAALRNVYPGRPASEGGLELVPVTRHVDVEHTRDLVMQSTEHSSAVETAALNGGKGAGLVLKVSTAGSELKKRRVWIDTTVGESGALVWGPELTGTAADTTFNGVEGQFMLDSVRTLHPGVADSPFLSQLYAARDSAIVSPDACLTLTSQGSLDEVSLVFTSLDDATLLLHAMDQLLIEGHYRLYENERLQKEAEKAEAAAKGQSLPTMMSLDNDSTMTMLSEGSLFYCVSDMLTAQALREVDGASTSVTKEECKVRVGHRLRYGHRGGGLVWAAPVPANLAKISDATEENTEAWESAANEQGNFLPIQEIAEIMVGHQHSMFKNPLIVAAGFDAACSFTLVTRRGLELALVAPSSEEAVAWLLGIQTLLVSLGGAQVAITADANATEASAATATPASQAVESKTAATEAKSTAAASVPEPASAPAPSAGGRRFTVLASAVANSATSSTASYASGTGRSSYAIPDDIPDDPTQALMQLAAKGKETGQHLVGVSPDATIAMMMRGREFFLYDDKKDHPVRVVFRYHYVSAAEREAEARASGRPVAAAGTAGDMSKGAFEWRTIGAAANSPALGTIALAAITDVYIGKQSPALKKPVAAAAPTDCCFSITGVDGTSASLQADAPFQVSAWLFGLSQILSASGRDVVLDERTEAAVTAAATTSSPAASSATAGRGRRYTVLPSQAQKQLASVAASGASAEVSAGLGRQANDPAIQPLVDGASFFFYTLYGVTRVFVWFDTIPDTPEDAAAGKGSHALCFEPWTGSLGQQRFVSTAQTRILFDDLTDIFVGAHAKDKAYEQKYEGRSSVAENRLSFKAGEKRRALGVLHLEANTKAQSNSWLQGIQRIMAMRGQPVLASKDGGRTATPLNAAAANIIEQQKKKKQVDEKVEPRSVLSAEEQEIYAAHTPSTILRKVMSNDPSLKALSLANALRVMMGGESFNLYPAARTAEAADALIRSQKFKPQRITLRYVPSVESKGLSLAHKGSLVWSQDGTQHSANLDKLTDIVLGVSQPPFAQAVAAVSGGNKFIRAPLKSRAVILVFGGLSLCLEAADNSVATRWLWAINSLIRQSGRGTRQAEAEAEANAAAEAAAEAAKAAAAAAAAAASRALPTTSRARAPSPPAPSTASVATASATTTTPATPAATSGLSAERKSALAKDATVALMTAGQTLSVHKADQGRVGDFSVWYSIEDNAIAWVPRRQPKIVAADKSNSIVITSIAEIILGTASPAFAKESANVDAESCVALVAADGRTLAIEADSKEQLQAWMAGISHILMVTGLSAVAQPGASEGTSAASGGASKSRRFTVLPSAAPTQAVAAASATAAAAESSAPSKATTLEALSPNATPFESGISFTQFVADSTASGGVARLDALVWCTRQGILCWANSRNAEAVDAGTKKLKRVLIANQQIHVGALTEICVGRQTPLTSSSALNDLDEQQSEAVASLLGPDGFELHVMASNPVALDDWLESIAKTCEDLGRDVINENTEQPATESTATNTAAPTPASTPAAAPTPSSSTAPSARSRRMTIRPYERPNILPQNPHEVLKQIGQRRPTLMALQADSTLRMIAEGRTGWSMVTRDPQTFKVTKTPISLFHSNDTQNGTAPLGFLCWCAPGQRDEHPGRRLGLHLIEDVYVGKQTSVMHSPELADVAGNLCVSLVSSSAPSALTEINLVCESEDQLSTWLFGLNAVLTEGGDKTVTVEESSGVDQQGKRTNNRRFSVLPTH